MQLVPRKTSEQVFVLLGRAVPIVDGWFDELTTANDMSALAAALTKHLEGRRQAIELARTGERPPAA